MSQHSLIGAVLRHEPSNTAYLYTTRGHFMSDENLPLEVISREAEIIVCYRTPHDGVWVQHVMNAAPTKANLHAHQTALEMAVGNARVFYNAMRDEERYNNAEPLTVRIATPEKWQFLMGLVVCELAERIQIA